MMQEQNEPVATNIITGWLGVGKTSLISQLLKHKPENERWAVLINEFGEVGIDGGLIDGQSSQGIYVKEIPGGCMCCTAGLSMQIALNRLLQQIKPHRLIIEPTGLGHPIEVLATLQAPHYRHLIDVKATFTLLDARCLLAKNWQPHATFMQQIAVADYIVAAKPDLYQDNEIPVLIDFLNQQGKSKGKLIEVTGFAAILAMLDDDCGFQAQEFPDSPAISGDRENSIVQQLCEHDVVKIENNGDGYFSFGWAYNAKRQFNFDSALATLSKVTITRLKAVLITDRGVIAFNIVNDELTYQTLQKSADSRLEFICAQRADAKRLEQYLEDKLFSNCVV